jgi:hypothetical protein
VAPTGVADTFSGPNSALAGVTLAVGTSPSESHRHGQRQRAHHDTDVDSPHANLTAAPGTTSSTNGGSATMNADGTFSYTPPPGFTGDDTFPTGRWF